MNSECPSNQIINEIILFLKNGNYFTFFNRKKK